MNTSILLAFVIVASYILYPGFYTNLGDVTVLGWKTLRVEVHRRYLLWAMKRQWEKSDREFSKLIRTLKKEGSQE